MAIVRIRIEEFPRKTKISRVVTKQHEQIHLRYLFLEAIAELEANDERLHVLHDLRDTVLPITSIEPVPPSEYVTDMEGYELPVLRLRPLPGFYALARNAFRPVKTEEFLRAINRWSHSWNLPSFVSEQARHTLLLWAKKELDPCKEPLHWGPLLNFQVEHTTQPFRIEDGYMWDMNVESRGKAKERILADIERRLDEYIEAAEQLAADAGFVSLKLRKPIHFEWLVRYQVQGWSQDRIALEYDVGKDTVNKALHDKAKVLGIELRRNPNMKTYR